MDLSLDELIKKNKKSKQNVTKKKGPAGPTTKKVGGKIARKPLGKPVRPTTGSLIDARSKIIKKNRVKIRDARERIAENARKSIKDARELISSKKPAQRPQKKITIPRSRAPGRLHKIPIDPDLLMDDDDDIDLRQLSLKPISSLKRTVRNDMFARTVPPLTMPKMPQFSINQDLSRHSPDPFDCYQLPPRRPAPLPPSHSERVIGYQPGRSMNAHMDAYPARKSILRSSSQRDDHDDRFDDDRYMLAKTLSADSIRSRLYNESERESRNESAGIFAKLPVRGDVEQPATPTGHRIVISNLHKSVTQSDVHELFEDIGDLVTANLVRPGTAEVVYKRLGDAELAVETYHNRQLDGQPMKCMLVRPSKHTFSRY